MNPGCSCQTERVAARQLISHQAQGLLENRQRPAGRRDEQRPFGPADDAAEDSIETVQPSATPGEAARQAAQQADGDQHADAGPQRAHCAAEEHGHGELGYEPLAERDAEVRGQPDGQSEPDYAQDMSYAAVEVAEEGEDRGRNGGGLCDWSADDEGQGQESVERESKDPDESVRRLLDVVLRVYLLRMFVHMISKPVVRLSRAAADNCTIPLNEPGIPA